MELNQILPLIAGISFVWLLALSIFCWRIFAHYNRLIKSTNEQELGRVLDKILVRQNLAKNEIVRLDSEIKRIALEGLSHIQKASVVRFNPFRDTGGDSSFSVALLDGNLNGIVITGLHTRERTRVYIKPVQKGKSSYEISKEEERAIADAIKK